MNVIITGGAGFIGSALVRAVCRFDDWTVLNIDKLTYAGHLLSVKEQETLSPAHYRFLQADICDAEAMCRAFADFQPDIVFHLAAESHVDRSLDAPAEFIKTNIIGTYTLLETARSYWDALPDAKKTQFRFHHVSTDEVYGSLELTDSQMFTEDTPYNPRSPYSASKAGSDHLVRAWYHSYGLPITISNASNNYGPYQHPEKFIPRMIVSALAGQPLPVYGDGQNVRDWIYVGDHVRAVVLVATKGQVGRTYNIGGHNECSNMVLAEMICGILDAKRPRSGGSYKELITCVADRPGHDRRYAVDTNRIETELGWKAEKPFNIGITETVGWYLSNE